MSKSTKIDPNPKAPILKDTVVSKKGIDDIRESLNKILIFYNEQYNQKLKEFCPPQINEFKQIKEKLLEKYSKDITENELQEAINKYCNEHLPN